MKGKIVVAGMGHGGLAAHGYDVTVLEQKSKGTLGYDWTDILTRRRLPPQGCRCRIKSFIRIKRI